MFKIMIFDPSDISAYADDILHAAGSGLRHYMPSTREAIIQAVHAALESAYGKGIADAHKAMDAVLHLRGG